MSAPGAAPFRACGGFTVKRARAFDAHGDLFAQFFRIASQALCLLAEPLQLFESQFVL
jgi:hypothetical protein